MKPNRDSFSLEPDLNIPYGLEDLIVDTTAICELKEGSLSYRGYPIIELVEYEGYEGVAHLLLKGELPSEDERLPLRQAIHEAASLHESVLSRLRLLKEAGTSLLDAMQSAIVVHAVIDKARDKRKPETELNRSIRLIGAMIGMMGYWASLDYKRLIQLDPTEELGSNLLAMIRGVPPKKLDAREKRAIETALVLYAEHEFAASTYVARIAVSTRADLYSGILAAISALRGELHGGALPKVVRQHDDLVRDKPHIGTWVQLKRDTGELVWGFGHRLYKQVDVRVDHMFKYARKLPGYEQIEEVIDALRAAVHHHIQIGPNLDFPAAYAFELLKIPRDYFVPIFACARTAGWCAHIIEQRQREWDREREKDSEKRSLLPPELVRPIARYVGQRNRVVPQAKQSRQRPNETKPAEQPAVAADSKATSDPAPQSKERRREKYQWLAEAMLLVKKHPGWTDAQIAREVQIDPAQLSRSPEYQKAAEDARGRRSDIHPGYIVKNSATSLTTVEAVSPGVGDKIPGSKYYRGKCPECGADTRVETRELAETMPCESCR